MSGLHRRQLCAAVSSGQITVQTATGYNHGAPHSDWNWSNDSTIAVLHIVTLSTGR